MFVVVAGADAAGLDVFGVDFAAGLFAGADVAGAGVVAGLASAGVALGSGTGAGAVCAWPTDVSDALANKASVMVRKYIDPPTHYKRNSTSTQRPSSAQELLA